MKNEGRSEVHLAIMVRKDKYAVREYNDERCMGLSDFKLILDADEDAKKELDKLGGKMRGKAGRDLRGYLVDLFGRMLVVKCTPKNGDERDNDHAFLAINYHGINRNLNDEKRCRLWTVACRMWAAIADTLKLPVVIGCDANIKLDNFRGLAEHLDPWNRVHVQVYKPYRRGAAPEGSNLEGHELGVIDFIGSLCPKIIASKRNTPAPHVSIEGVEFLEYSDEEDLNSANKVFSHDALLATVKLSRSHCHVKTKEKNLWEAKCGRVSCSASHPTDEIAFVRAEGAPIPVAMESRSKPGIDDMDELAENIVLVKRYIKRESGVPIRALNETEAEKAARLILLGLSLHDALLYTLKPAEDVTLTFLIKANVILDKSALTLDEAQPTKTLEDKASVHYEDEHGSHIITALQARLMKMRVPYEVAKKVDMEYKIEKVKRDDEFKEEYQQKQWDIRFTAYRQKTGRDITSGFLDQSLGRPTAGTTGR